MEAKRQILTGCRSWSSTPWIYSSLVGLQFAEDRTGKLIYGWGQTIYAAMEIKYQLLNESRMQLFYLESSKFGRHMDYQLEPGQSVELAFTLQEQENTFEQDTVRLNYHYRWLLTLDKSPFPADLILPYKLPPEYYGYGECLPRYPKE